MIRLRPLAATLAAAALLAGCSNADPEIPAVAATSAPATSAPVAASTPSASTTPASMATRELAVPKPSELAMEFSEQGGGAFASYYVQVLNYSRNSGDTSLLQSISDEGCAGCAYDISEVAGFLKHGYINVGLETKFHGVSFRSWEPDLGELQMDVLVSRTPHNVVDQDDRVLEEVPGLDEAEFFLWLKWIDNHWVIWEAN